MFNISDKVVCVDDEVREELKKVYPDGPVVKGRVYVVSGISTAGHYPGTTLVGAARIDPVDDQDYGWSPNRFRKLSEVQAENQLKRENEKVGDKREAWERQMDAILKRIQQL